MSTTTDSFYQLTPQRVMSAVEAAGWHPTGEYIQLNSYENRVFDVLLEPALTPPELAGHVIVKFYRPLRWSESAILAEHEFLADLKAGGLPAVAPLIGKDGSLSVHDGLFMAAFPKARGRMPQELSLDHLQQIGRLLAQLHNVGAKQSAPQRPQLTAAQYGEPALEALEEWIPVEIKRRYYEVADALLEWLDEHLDERQFFRIHGDCHRGNLLLTDVAGEPQRFFFVDFDDFCLGPAVQDFWMLYSGGEESQQEQEALLAGYEELRELDHRQLRWIPALRGLRILHYSGWIARRWEDPNFPQLFPQFTSYNYWAEEVEALEAIVWRL